MSDSLASGGAARASGAGFSKSPAPASVAFFSRLRRPRPSSQFPDMHGSRPAPLRGCEYRSRAVRRARLERRRDRHGSARVRPEQPSCNGTSSQWHPVTSTNQITFTTTRCGVGGLPPRLPADFSAGRNGDSSSKNSSGIRASAILAPSKVHLDLGGPCAHAVPNQVLSGPNRDRRLNPRRSTPSGLRTRWDASTAENARPERAPTLPPCAARWVFRSPTGRSHQARTETWPGIRRCPVRRNARLAAADRRKESPRFGARLVAMRPAPNARRPD